MLTRADAGGISRPRWSVSGRTNPQVRGLASPCVNKALAPARLTAHVWGRAKGTGARHRAGPRAQAQRGPARAGEVRGAGTGQGSAQGRSAGPTAAERLAKRSGRQAPPGKRSAPQRTAPGRARSEREGQPRLAASAPDRAAGPNVVTVSGVGSGRRRARGGLSDFSECGGSSTWPSPELADVGSLRTVSSSGHLVLLLRRRAQRGVAMRRALETR